MGGNLFGALYESRARTAHAYRFEGGPPRSVGEARRLVGCMAAALQEMGVAKGDRVSFLLEKSEEVLLVAHACLQLGAILHPLNTAYTDAEVAALVRDAEPRLFLCSEENAARLSAEIGRVRIETLGPGLSGRLGVRASAVAALESVLPVASDDVAALLYTSGTTGKPKGACITHGNLRESARALAQVWSLGPGDRLLHALPMYHAHGLLTAVNSMLVGGGSVLFLPRFDPVAVVGALRETNVIMGVPTHYSRLLKEGELASGTGNLRLAISGSAPLPHEVAQRFEAAANCALIERYGATETAIVTAIPAGVRDRVGFVGWALPGVEIRVRQEDGTCASTSALGGLETRGHNVFAGYWRRPDADSEAFSADGWFVTGDIAEIDATGCVRLLGRSKDLIITGGLNVYPKEVEDAIDGLLDGGESAVFGVDHPDFGEAVIAVVEGDSVSEASLISTLRKTLAAYKVPKRIISIASIPRNRLGKVVKSDLRAAHADLFVDRANQKRE